MAPKTLYRLTDAVPADVLEQYDGLDPLLAQLLWNRGLRDRDVVDRFLNPDYDLHQHDPFLFTDMQKAVARVLEAVKNNEHIVIYSDYDCDGIPGGVVLHDFFRAIEYEHFTNYIPHRHYEGFGLSTEGVEKCKERGTTLIITIDCGTGDVAAVEKANELGIDVIITDHHEPGNHVADAYALINPKRDDAYPFKGLCGAGVVYKLVQALIAEGAKQHIFEFGEGKEKWFLDMVGLATIADMVPLVDENRVFAHFGLTVLRKSRRPGLQKLFRKTRTNQSKLTEDDLGFTLAPRINAASRMDTPEDAFNMLATTDESEAGVHVDHLEKLNNERKGVVAGMAKEIKKRIGGTEDMGPVLVMGNPEWRPSLVGLAANTLSETYKRPAFLWGRDGAGIIKGSCRSYGDISVIAIMEAAKECFLEYGGHHGAGGFSVQSEKIHHLSEQLQQAYETLPEDILKHSHEHAVDAELTLEAINSVLLRTLRTLAPYGEGNTKPLFRFSDIVPMRVETFGKTKNHTRLLFKTDGGSIEAISFFTTPDQFDTVPKEGAPLSLIAHVEESFFMNRPQTRLRIVDIV